MKKNEKSLKCIVSSRVQSGNKPIFFFYQPIPCTVGTHFPYPLSITTFQTIKSLITAATRRASNPFFLFSSSTSSCLVFHLWRPHSLYSSMSSTSHPLLPLMTQLLHRKRSFGKHHCREYWVASLCCSETRWLHRKAWRDPIYISPVHRSRFPWTHPARDPHPSKWKRCFFYKARFLSVFLPTDKPPSVALLPSSTRCKHGEV